MNSPTPLRTRRAGDRADDRARRLVGALGAEPVGAPGDDPRRRWPASRRCRRARAARRSSASGPAISTCADSPLLGVDVGRRLDDLVARRAGTAARCAGTGSDRRSSPAARSPRRRGTRSGPRRSRSRCRRAQPAASISSMAARTRATSAANERFVATTTRRRRPRGAAMSAPSSTWYGFVAQDRAVLERAGLAFGRVDDHRRAFEARSSSRARCATCARSGSPRRRGRAAPTLSISSMISSGVSRRARRCRGRPVPFVLVERLDRRRKQHPVHKRHDAPIYPMSKGQKPCSNRVQPFDSTVFRSFTCDVRAPSASKATSATLCGTPSQCIRWAPMSPRRTVDELLDEARTSLQRVTPAEAARAAAAGALIVDIRPSELRSRDGTIPGALIVGRNVLEWRLDPVAARIGFRRSRPTIKSSSWYATRVTRRASPRCRCNSWVCTMRPTSTVASRRGSRRASRRPAGSVTLGRPRGGAMTKLGYQIPNFTYPGVGPADLFEVVAAQAAAADRSGFDTVLLMDHFYQLPHLGSTRRRTCSSATRRSARSARETTTVRLGALVTGNTYRNPTLLAKIDHRARHRLGGPGAARHRRGLVRAGARLARLRVRHVHRSVREARGSAADHPRRCSATSAPPSTASTTGEGRDQPAAARRAHPGHDRWQWREEDAAHGRAVRRRVEPHVAGERDPAQARSDRRALRAARARPSGDLGEPSTSTCASPTRTNRPTPT